MSQSNSVKNTISSFNIIGIFSLILFQSFSAISQPVFDSEPVTQAAYGSFYTYEVQVSGNAVSVTETGGNLPPGINFNFITNTLSGTAQAAGTFSVVLEAFEAADPFTIVKQEYNIEVATAGLTVTADPQTITYGDVIPPLTFSYLGFVNGDDATDLDTQPTATTTADGSSVAGTYPISVSGGIDPDYIFTYVSSTLTIEKADQTINFTDIVDKTYGDAPITLDANSSSGLPVSFTVVSGNATISGSTLTITGAGNITVAANQVGNTNYNAAPTVEKTFAVAKKALTVTADNKSIIFGAAIPALTFTYSGFVNGDDATDLDTAPTASTTATAGSNAGTYPITLAGGLDANYSFTYVNAILTITKADQTISFTAIAGKTYGDAAFTLSASSTSGLPVSFTVVSGNATISGSTLTITGAGNITVAANQVGNTNYNAAPTVERTFTVAKKALTVTADNKSIIFGAAIPALTFTYSGFVNGDDATDLDTAPTASTTATAGSNTGTYPITLAGGLDANYSFTYVNAILTITKADQTISFTAIAGKTYGDAAFTLSASSTSGLPVSFTVVSGNATISGSTLTITGAGNITVAANQIGNTNYNAAPTVERTFTVAKKALTVTADNKSIIFGAAIPALTFTYSGFVNGDDATDLDTAPNASTTATAGSNAGTYPITLAGGLDANYSFTYVNAILTIAKADQTITFTAIADKTYGDAAFTLSASSTSGLPVSFTVVSGNATISGSTLTITGAGNITVAANQIGNTNYNAAPTVERTFTVAKKALTVAADNKSIIFGAAIPALTFTYSGFVNGDDATDLDTAPTASTTATAGSNAGTYPITLAGGLDANYSFTYVNAILTIAKADQTITFPAIANKIFTDPNFNLNASSSSGLSITYSVVSGNVTISGNTVSITGTGNVTIRANQPGNVNFNAATPAERTFTINKATAGITISNLNQDYNGNPRPVTVTTNPSGLSFTVTYNGSTTAPTMVGSYAVNVLINDANYEGIRNVTLIIKGPIFTSTPVTTVNQSQTYNYNIVAVDYDESINLTITNIISLPSWLSLNDNGDGTALLTGTPNNNQVGIYGIALQVSDGSGDIDQQFFNIEVINVNDPPIFTSTPVTEATNNVQYTYNITTNDIDNGDVVNLTFNIKPSWLNFTTTGFPQGNGRLQGTPQNSNRGQNQMVRLRATDQNGGITFQEFTINVDFPNTAPQFTSTPVTEATQDEVYTYNITVEDADNDAVTLRAIAAPGWLNFSTTGLTATLTGTPGNSQVGDHVVVLEAEDFLGLKTNQNFTITVENVNDDPEITSVPVTSAIQNILYEYHVEATDIDADDEVSISINDKPDWLNFDGTSLISGTPGAQEVDNSPFYVEILATDLDGATDIQSFEITVTTQNQPPTIDAIADQGPLIEDDLQEFEIPLTGITTGGESNQVITIAVSTDYPDLFEYLAIDYTSPESAGILRYKILPDSFGIATVTLRLVDNGPEEINFFETSFKIEVMPVNDTPEFISEPMTRIQPEENYRYEIVTIDADPGDELSIFKTVGPAWLVLTDNGDGTAVLQGQAPPTATNENITIEVSDLEGAIAAQSFVISINQAPVASNFTIEMQEDVPHQFTRAEFDAAFNDTDGDEIEALKFTWNRGSIQRNGVTVESGEELDYTNAPNITYTPPANIFGTITIQWAASDGFVFSEYASITIEIDTINDAPLLTSIETTILEYIQGAAPINISNTITVTDVDNENMKSAVIQISENYDPEEDRLAVVLGVNSTITENFNNSTGTLLLEGTASKSAYENALRTVTYQNINPLTTNTDPKSVGFMVSDSSMTSETVIRQLEVTSILPELDIVNAFTPDGNGVNDTWDFGNLDAFEEVMIRIYNSEGIEVYKCESNACEWDGTYKGEPLPAKTYFYLINLNNGRRQYEGTVTILK